MTDTASRLWRNWGGNQQCAPAEIAQPRSVEDLAEVVKSAGKEGLRVKAVGSGHSFTDVACTSGVQVRLDEQARVLRYDPEPSTVTVASGMTLAALAGELARRGLALANLGDVGYQTVAGAISTGTHGTGVGLGGLATDVVGLQLVTADGSVVSCSPDEETEIFAAARVGLGALGIISTVTLRCQPAFNLRAVEEPIRLDEVLSSIDELVEGNDHFEFFWVPHTGWALTKRNNRTDEPVSPGRGRRFFRDKILFENLAFGAVTWLGRLRPRWIPRLARIARGSGRTEYVDRSDRIFTSPRWVRFCEMEYAIPRAAAAGVVERVRRYVEESGLYVGFPVEVRFTAGDDIPLSTASGRQSCYVAVHMPRGVPYEQYFRGVEAIMDSVRGRPHWGKLHYQTAPTLSSRYPGWERFQAVRARLDPDGLFANAYTDRVLGPR
jgi:FAD-linked oxidoreductase